MPCPYKTVADLRVAFVEAARFLGGQHFVSFRNEIFSLTDRGMAAALRIRVLES